jgi:hypothetical protein
VDSRFQARAAHDRLPTAGNTAITAFAAGLDWEVAALRVLARPVPEGAAVDQEGNSDPRAERDHQEPPETSPCPMAVLADSSGDGIIVDYNRDTELRPKHLRQVEPREPGKGVRVPDNAERLLHRPAGADANSAETATIWDQVR